MEVHTGGNSAPRVTQIIGQRKEFYKQRIPESNCASKETVDILITSRNGERKVKQRIRITNRPPSRISKLKQLNQFRLTSTKANK